MSVQQESRAAVVALCDPESVYKAVPASRVPWPEVKDDEWEGAPLPGGVPVGSSVQVGGMRPRPWDLPTHRWRIPACPNHPLTC